MRKRSKHKQSKSWFIIFRDWLFYCENCDRLSKQLQDLAERHAILMDRVERRERRYGQG